MEDYLRARWRGDRPKASRQDWERRDLGVLDISRTSMRVGRSRRVHASGCPIPLMRAFSLLYGVLRAQKGHRLARGPSRPWSRLTAPVPNGVNYRPPRKRGTDGIWTRLRDIGAICVWLNLRPVMCSHSVIAVLPSRQPPITSSAYYLYSFRGPSRAAIEQTIRVSTCASSPSAMAMSRGQWI